VEPSLSLSLNLRLDPSVGFLLMTQGVRVCMPHQVTYGRSINRVGQIEDTLHSLLQQTVLPDEILVAIPNESKREGGKPYQIPDWLRTMDRVKILETDIDYGPSTKLIPAVQVFASLDHPSVCTGDVPSAPRLC
jgi:hypothetical protein